MKATFPNAYSALAAIHRQRLDDAANAIAEGAWVVAQDAAGRAMAIEDMMAKAAPFFTNDREAEDDHGSDD